MTKRYIALMTILLTLLCGVFSVRADDDDRPTFKDDTVIVVMKPRVGVQTFSARAYDYTDCFPEFNITDVKRLQRRNSGVSLFSLNRAEGDALLLTLGEAGEDNVLYTVDALNALPEVEYAQPNYCYYPCSAPNDTSYFRQYSLKDKVDAEKVWELDIDCSDVSVAVVDSSILSLHEDLSENLWTNKFEIPNNNIDDDGNGFVDDYCGWDFVFDDNDPEAVYWHGTHVAGIISAATNNGKGVASLARNARLAPLKVFHNTSTGTGSNVIADAIDYAGAMGFEILNCSLGSNPGTVDTYMKNAIERYPNMLVIAAAGNQNNNNDTRVVYPSELTKTCDNVISVASTDENDALSVFSVSSSNYGRNSVDLAAPGSNIYSADSNGENSYSSKNGTSMACPLVTSTAVVLKARNRDLTPGEIKEAIVNSVDPISSLAAKVKSGGRLNAYNAVTYYDLKPTPSESPDVDASPTPSESPDIDVSPTPSESPDVDVSPTPSESPDVDVSPTPSESPDVNPELRDWIEFTPSLSDSSVVIAQMMFEKTSPKPSADDIMLIVAYKENGVLKAVDIPSAGGMTALINIPVGFEDYDMEVYVWNKAHKPLMDIQRYDTKGEVTQ